MNTCWSKVQISGTSPREPGLECDSLNNLDCRQTVRLDDRHMEKDVRKSTMKHLGVTEMRAKTARHSREENWDENILTTLNCGHRSGAGRGVVCARDE